MTADKALKTKHKVPFQYETKSPYSRPIMPGLRAVVARARRAGRRVEYSMRLEHGYFVYYVNVR
jgi:hypothetical protein